MPVFTQNGEIGKVYADLQDGNGEQEVQKIFVNKQDGNGEQLVWQNTILIDDFEAESLSAPPNNWSLPAQSGTVEIEDASYNANQSMGFLDDGYAEAWADASNFDSVPQPGDRWEFYFRTYHYDSSSQGRFYFGRQTSAGTDAYNIQFYGDGTFRLQVTNGGSPSTVAADYNVTYSEYKWHRAECWWQHPDKSNDFVLELTDTSDGQLLTTIQGDDTTHGSGDLGALFNSNAGGGIDYIRITDRTA